MHDLAFNNMHSHGVEGSETEDTSPLQCFVGQFSQPQLPAVHLTACLHQAIERNHSIAQCKHTPNRSKLICSTQNGTTSDIGGPQRSWQNGSNCQYKQNRSSITVLHMQFVYLELDSCTYKSCEIAIATTLSQGRGCVCDKNCPSIEKNCDPMSMEISTKTLHFTGQHKLVMQTQSSSSLLECTVTQPVKMLAMKLYYIMKEQLDIIRFFISDQNCGLASIQGLLDRILPCYAAIFVVICLLSSNFD